jgi:putative von willebrand factor type A domain protein
MELVFWQLSLALIIIIALLWFAEPIILRRYSRSKRHDALRQKLPIANTSRLRAFPLYIQQVKRYKRLLSVVLGLHALLLIMMIILAGRPSSVAVVSPEVKNRDIVLCLDVSRSMYEYDVEIIKTYRTLARKFDGERLGLVLFDRSPAVIFPLTDDASLIDSKLSLIEKALTPPGTLEYFDILSGTVVSNGQGSSLIGDGLASCIGRFDKLDSKRSRSIILGTDNQLAGTPIISLPEAAELAKQKDIRVYGIYPNSNKNREAEAAELKRTMLATSGDYYALRDKNTIPNIVQKIAAQDTSRFKGTPRVTRTDQPQLLLYGMLIIIISLIIIDWRLCI